VPYVRATGSHRDLGRAVGEAARPQIEGAIAYYREHFAALAGIAFAEAERRVRPYLALARRYLPQCVEELEGMAEASRQPLDALLVPNCAEEFVCVADGSDAAPGVLPSAGGGRLCTAVAVSVGGRHLVGHN